MTFKVKVMLLKDTVRCWCFDFQKILDSMKIMFIFQVMVCISVGSTAPFITNQSRIWANFWPISSKLIIAPSGGKFPKLNHWKRVRTYTSEPTFQGVCPHLQPKLAIYRANLVLDNKRLSKKCIHEDIGGRNSRSATASILYYRQLLSKEQAVESIPISLPRSVFAQNVPIKLIIFNFIN